MSAPELKRRVENAIDARIGDVVKELLTLRFTLPVQGQTGMTVEQYAMFCARKVEAVFAMQVTKDLLADELRKMENPDDPPKPADPGPAY